MAIWHVKATGTNGNGTSEGSAWVGVNNIVWGNVAEGDTLTFYAGTYGQLDVNKSNVTINRGGDGFAIFYGGRAADLPHSLTGDTVTGGVDGQSGITLDSHEGITIDGGKLGGFTIHGFNRDGISMYSDSAGNHTFRNLFIHQNGERGTGDGQIDGHGIRIAGNDNLIEDCIIINNRADAIQNVWGSRLERMTVRRCILGNTIAHRIRPAMDWNFRSHNDGIQTYFGADDCLYEDLVITGCWHGLIVDDDFGTFNNSTIRRITFVSCKNTIRHKNNGSGSNVFEDWISQKWWSYPNDNMTTFEGGTNFRNQGSNNTISRIYVGGKGSFESYGSGHTFSQMFTDGTIPDPVPNSTTLDPQFDNAGPVGRSSDNVGSGITTRSLKPNNSALDVINVTYYGFLDYLQKASPTVWKTVPSMIRATGNNSPIFGANSSISASTSGSVSRQVDCEHPDGATLTYTIANAPSGVSISSTGLITGTPANTGTFVATVTASGGGKSSEMLQTFVVTGTSTGDEAPQVSPIGAQSSTIGQAITPLQVQANDPQNYALSYALSNAPAGLSISSTGLITGTPSGESNGTVTVTVTAATSSLSTTISFLWVVTLDGGGSSGGGLVGITTLFPPADPFYFKTEEHIYHDSLKTGWTAYSGANSTISVQSDEPYQGQHDIEITQTQTDTVGLQSTTERTISDYESVDLFVKSSHNFDLTLWNQTSSAGNVATVGDHISGGWVADTWQKVSIPVGSFTGSETAFDEIRIAPAASQTNITINIDRIYLTEQRDPIDLVVASSEADDLSAVLNNAPAGISVDVTQRQGNVNGGTDTVDTTADGLQGDGPSLTQVYNLVDGDGSPFTITQKYFGSPTSGNPGAPALTGSTVGSGFTEYSTGGASGNRRNRLELECSRPFSGLVWGAHGIADTTGEFITAITNSGTQTGMGSASTGTVTWTGLPANTTKVSFEVSSESDGNNHGFGPTGDITFDLEEGTPGEMRLVGSPTEAGVFDATIDVSDAGGLVGSIPFRVVMPSGDDPVIIQPAAQTGAVGDSVNFTISVRNPQNQALTWKIEDGPPGLSINSSGQVTGTLEAGGNYDMYVSVRDSFGSYDLTKFGFLVSGGTNFGLTNISGPVGTGRISSDQGPIEHYSPSIFRNQLIDVYSKGETDSKDQAVIDALRDSVQTDLDTLKKIAAAMLNRADFGEYILSLIDGGGGSFDPSAIYTILGVALTASTLPDFTYIIPNGSDIVEALDALATEINQLDITQQNGGLSIAGNTVAANFGNSAASPTGQTYANFISELELATDAEVTNAVAPKANQTEVDTISGNLSDILTALGIAAGAENMGAFTGGVVTDNTPHRSQFQEAIDAIVQLQNSSAGTFNLDNNTIAANTSGTSTAPTSHTPGQIRALLGIGAGAEANEDTTSDAVTEPNTILKPDGNGRVNLGGVMVGSATSPSGFYEIDLGSTSQDLFAGRTAGGSDRALIQFISTGGRFIAFNSGGVANAFLEVLGNGGALKLRSGSSSSNIVDIRADNGTAYIAAVMPTTYPSSTSRMWKNGPFMVMGDVDVTWAKQDEEVNQTIPIGGGNLIGTDITIEHTGRYQVTLGYSITMGSNDGDFELITVVDGVDQEAQAGFPTLANKSYKGVSNYTANISAGKDIRFKATVTGGGATIHIARIQICYQSEWENGILTL